MAEHINPDPLPDDGAPSGLDQWLTDGGRDVPDSDLSAPAGTEPILPK
jgi:hypothetical protein